MLKFYTFKEIQDLKIKVACRCNEYFFGKGKSINNNSLTPTDVKELEMLGKDLLKGYTVTSDDILKMDYYLTKLGF